jgi:hypothetical protein
MNHNYIQVIVCVLLSFSGYSASIAQSSGPEFLDCSSTPDSLCVQDEGVRLPSNNQLFLGEEDPDATSCSVHVTQKKRVKSHCGDTLQYEVLLFLNDTTTTYILKSLTSVTTDSVGETEIMFNTEESTEELIRQSGIPYTVGCGNEFLIKWVVTDSCGAIVICEQYVELYDCIMPQGFDDPEELFIIEINFSGQALVSARDFIHTVIDDCSPMDSLLFSLKSNEYLPDSSINCDEVPAYGVEILKSIWVADQGYDIDCNGTIEWQERKIYQHPFQVVYVDGFFGCDPVYDYLLAGTIETEFAQGIKDVTVTLSSPGQVDYTYVTAGNGNYSFQQIVNGEATIRAARNDFHKNGISTLDLVKIQKHLLGIAPLESPYQFIAADANNSQNVSAIDLIEIRKMILGIYDEFPSNQSWRFVPAAYVFPDPFNPWLNMVYPYTFHEAITITDLENPGNLDFIGIKIGDVNGTAQPNFTQLLPRESLIPFELKTDQQVYHSGDIINVPIRISSDQQLTGFQFTLAASGMEFLNIIPGQVALSDENFVMYNDKMTVSWFDENTIDVAADAVLFTLQLRATKSGNIGQALSLNSEITEAEIYLADEETLLPFLNVHDQHAEDKLHIISCAPNPWKVETMINFYLPKSDQVNFTLTDISGREISSTTSYLKKGCHQHHLKLSDFQGRGILFFRINTSTMSEITKMIVVE